MNYFKIKFPKGCKLTKKQRDAYSKIVIETLHPHIPAMLKIRAKRMNQWLLTGKEPSKNLTKAEKRILMNTR